MRLWNKIVEVLAEVWRLLRHYIALGLVVEDEDGKGSCHDSQK